MAEVGQLLWTPSEAFCARSKIVHYQHWLKTAQGLSFGDYASLHRWSIADLPAFWESIWDYFEIQSSTGSGTCDH